MEVERREAGREGITYQIYMGAGGVDRELHKDETLRKMTFKTSTF